MALDPVDEAHALQIQAGIVGRKAGHTFEDTISSEINKLPYPLIVPPLESGHVFQGDPALLLLRFICARAGIKKLASSVALSTGALATSEQGKKWLDINGVSISRCKSDLIITIVDERGHKSTVGISTKQCNNRTPTNAQLYFTTARGFAKLLVSNGLDVSSKAILALRQFCGDEGYRPCDSSEALAGRRVDPRRFFWEEIEAAGRKEWDKLFTQRQDDITRLLLQKAYLNDPFTPDYVLHKTKRATAWTQTEVAIYSIEELLALSRAYKGFTTRPYSIRKGSYKDPPGVTHLAPRFGIV